MRKSLNRRRRPNGTVSCVAVAANPMSVRRLGPEAEPGRSGRGEQQQVHLLGPPSSPVPAYARSGTPAGTCLHTHPTVTVEPPYLRAEPRNDRLTGRRRRHGPPAHDLVGKAAVAHDDQEPLESC
jgi:hypothetical protein